VDVGHSARARRRTGRDPTQIENALGYAFGRQQVSQIYGAQNLYVVVLELLPNTSAMPPNCRIFTSAAQRTLVPLSAVTTVTTSTIPVVVNHQGELPASRFPSTLPLAMP